MIKFKIDEVNAEIETLIQKRDSNRDLSDDKLIMFRQQALIVSRKKDQCVENLKNMRTEQGTLEKQLKEKRKNNGEDGEVLRGEDVKYLFYNFYLKTEKMTNKKINVI